jgi:LacI family transcriptional regulator
MKIGKRIKITELAKKIGVSTSSVSRALNNHSNISQKTKNIIFKAAQKYNYIPNLNAKRLASQKPDTIAFITSLDPYAQDYVLMEFLSGLTKGIKDKPTELIVKFFSNEKTELDYYKKLVELNIADKFVFYRTKKKDKRIEFLIKNNINFVSWGRSSNVKNYAWIDMDNEKSINMLMQRLFEFGHRNIGLLNVHQSFNYGNQRKIAFEKFYKINGLKYNPKNYLDSLDSSTLAGINLTKKLLSQRNPPTAIICSLDKFFIGCLQECQKRELIIGKDISIVGYNDHDNYLSSQNLTFISHPLIKMGEASVKMLKNIEDGANPKDTSKLIEPILHEGKSDGKLES